MDNIKIRNEKGELCRLYDEIYNIPIRNDHQFPNATGELALQVFSFVANVNYDLVPSL